MLAVNSLLSITAGDWVFPVLLADASLLEEFKVFSESELCCAAAS